MNWFDPVFAALIPWSSALKDIWIYASLLWLGQYLSLLAGKDSVRARVTVSVVFTVLWASFMPDHPMEMFGAGRLPGLGREVFFVLLILGVGLLGIIGVLARRPRHLARSKLPVLTGGVGLVAIALLSIFYHMVLVNGLDQASRRDVAHRMEVTLQLPADALDQVCSSDLYMCGTGFPDTPEADFNRDAGDWLGVYDQAPHFTISHSNGTITAHPTYIWAARKADGQITWIWRSWQNHSDEVEAALFGILAVVALFWTLAPLSTEVLHRRAFARKRKKGRP